MVAGQASGGRPKAAYDIVDDASQNTGRDFRNWHLSPVFDQLIIGTGARESYFGHDEWSAVTSGLKSIERRDVDATPHPGCV